MKKLRLVLLAGITAVASPIHAQNIFTHTFSYDLGYLVDDWNSGGKYWMGYDHPIPVTPFTPLAGDTLVTTVNFLPGQSIVLHDGDTLWGSGVEFVTIAYENTGVGGAQNDYSSTASVTFFTPGGNVTMAGTTGSGVLAQNIFGNITTSSFEFTGFSMTTTVVTANEPTLMDQFVFWAVASGQTDLIGVTPVPEPSTLALTGLGGLCLLAFRRRGSRR